MDIIRIKGLFIIILVVAFGVCVLATEDVYAASGTRMLGFSARDSGMAGATTASSEDTSCLIKNPAGLVRIGNRVDVEYLNLIPQHVTMHTEGGVLANAGKDQKSTVTYIPAADLAVSYKVPGTDKYPVSVGCGMFTMAGVATDYPSPRINELLVGVYDKMIDLRSVRFAPGIAVALTDKLSIGATGNIALQGLKTDMAQTSYKETVGSGKWDFTAGGGFTLGLLYEFNEMLSAGASYESHTWMGYHRSYKDVLFPVDEPPVINVGLSFKPIKDLELTYDTRYINWTNVKAAAKGPESGGFGWRDQWVFAVGSEYTFRDKLKLRLGYDYNRSPIQAHVVFANAYLPVIMEHHLTMGFSYFILKDLSLDFAWEHHFVGVKVDSGGGDTYSQNGVGTKITAGADVIGVGLGYKF